MQQHTAHKTQDEAREGSNIQLTRHRTKPEKVATYSSQDTGLSQRR